LGPLTLKDPDIVPHPYSRKVTLPIGGHSGGKKPVEAILEVREGLKTSDNGWIIVLKHYAEDEQSDEPEQDDGEPVNSFVDALFDEIENLRLQVSIAIDSS
jgi:kinesin family protein 20